MLTPVILVLALAADFEVWSVGGFEAQLTAPQPIQSSEKKDLSSEMTVSTIGDAVATATLTLEKFKPEADVDSYAVYMSVGPVGKAVMDTTSAGNGFTIVQSSFRRLRVTIGNCERVSWLIIDDMKIGRADTRTITAKYMLHSFHHLPYLWSALSRAPRVLRPAPTGPPIEWITPSSFAWVMPADTLVVEQKADSVFQVTLRARVR